MAEKRSTIIAAFASLLSAAEQRILAHVAGRIAALDPRLCLSARMAEIERLKGEQEAALARLRQDIAAERRNTLRATLAALSVAYRRARTALAARQQSERAGMRRLRQLPALSRPFSTRQRWTAVRRMAVRVIPRRTNMREKPRITR